MQIQVFNNPEFGNVRVVMIDGEPWFVAKDVATALGYSNPQKAVRDHIPDKFKMVNESFTLGQGSSPVLINEAGLYKLVMRSELESAEKFSDWVCGDVLTSIRKTGSYSIQNPRPILSGNEVKLIGAMAEDIQSLFAVKRGIALCQAIDLVGKNLNLNFDSLKKLIPPADHETGYLNPTQLGQKLGGLPPQYTNKLLTRSGLQCKKGKDWRLTDAGKAYGEEMPYTRNGHSGYQIRWNANVLAVLTAELSRVS